MVETRSERAKRIREEISEPSVFDDVARDVVQLQRSIDQLALRVGWLESQMNHTARLIADIARTGNIQDD